MKNRRHSPRWLELQWLLIGVGLLTDIVYLLMFSSTLNCIVHQINLHTAVAAFHEFKINDIDVGGLDSMQHGTGCMYILILASTCVTDGADTRGCCRENLKVLEQIPLDPLFPSVSGQM